MKPPEISLIEGKRLGGLSMPMSYANNRTRELWQSFMPQKMRLPGWAAREMYSLQVYPPGYRLMETDPAVEFVKWAAVALGAEEALPSGLSELWLPGGEYAVFLHEGPAAAFIKTFQGIFLDWLPASGYNVDERPHFELLQPGYRPDDPRATEQIFIPVKPLNTIK